MIHDISHATVDGGQDFLVVNLLKYLYLFFRMSPLLKKLLMMRQQVTDQFMM